jgi:hypothetical protein
MLGAAATTSGELAMEPSTLTADASAGAAMANLSLHTVESGIHTAGAAPEAIDFVATAGS